MGGGMSTAGWVYGEARGWSRMGCGTWGLGLLPGAHVLSQSNGRPLDPKSLEHRPNMQLCLRPGVCILGEGPVRSGRARLGRGDNPITYNANILIVLHVQHVRQ